MQLDDVIDDALLKATATPVSSLQFLEIFGQKMAGKSKYDTRTLLNPHPAMQIVDG